MGQHVCDLGYRQPAFVSTPLGHDIRADARLEGVRDVFAQAGVGAVEAARPQLGNAFSTGYNGMLDLLSKTRPDVVFFLNDNMAFGGMMACQERGLSVPKDIGIAGFNGLDLTSVLPIKLTTVQTPRHLMGVTGARNLLARMNGVSVLRSTELDVKLVAGETTAPREGCNPKQNAAL